MNEKERKSGRLYRQDQVDILRMIKSSFRFTNEDDAREDPENLESFRKDFSKSYQELRRLEMTYDFKQDSAFMKYTVKPFWDKYCELKKSTLN